METTKVIPAVLEGSRLCGISYSLKVSAEEPTEQRRNQSPGETRKGERGLVGGGVEGGGGGRRQQTGRKGGPGGRA